MSETSIVEIALAVLAGLVGTIWAMLVGQIKDLYHKHETDEKELIKLQLQIADGYHKKPEIKEMFDGFKKYLDEKFGDLKASINEVNSRREH